MAAKRRKTTASPPAESTPAPIADPVPAPIAPPAFVPVADLRAKLKRLEDLRRQAKAALAGATVAAPKTAAKPKPKKRPRFSGTWGCGGD